MPSIQIDSDRLDEIASLLSLWESRGATYRNTLSEVIGFKREDPRSDFATQFRAYLTKAAPKFDFEKGDELPDSMKKEHTQKTEAGPLEIWIATKEGQCTTSVIAKYMLDSGWDFIDHRQIKSPLQKPVAEVKELLQEQVVDGKLYADCTPPLRGLLELIVKAFLNWYESQKGSQPKKFGEL